MQHSCAITGHRPKHFNFGYDEEHHACKSLKLVMAGQIEKLITGAGVQRFYTGMAQGVDIWAAEIILDFQKTYPNLELIAAIPFEGQANRWDDRYRERYFRIHQKCNDVVFTSQHYTPDCMFVRNRYLVDHALYLLAVYNGNARSGTGYTIQYAREHERLIYRIDADGFNVTTPADIEAYKRRYQFEVIDNKGLI